MQRDEQEAKSEQGKLRVVSLFSGIGGLDLGLHQGGMETIELCESWDPARQVLQDKFLGVPIAGDIRGYSPSGEYDVLAAGFPCVDLSHAGKQLGIFGPQSGLVQEVFRIAEETLPHWILLENVPNLLRLGRGAGIRFITNELERLGYTWSYRVLDSRAFGVPQRRNRVIVLASNQYDPSITLLGQESSLQAAESEPAASGFYWTEGRRGVGLVSGAVPTLKGGSTLGLPSAPAIWFPEAAPGQKFVLPNIEDAEELQGFDRGWTSIADREGHRSDRWKLVGNAVTVPLARWLSTRIVAESAGTLQSLQVEGQPHQDGSPWPNAAAGGPGDAISSVRVGPFPVRWESKRLDEVVLAEHCKPLSYRATRGFLSRVDESGINLDSSFIEDLEEHISRMRPNSEKVTQASTIELRLRSALSGIDEPYVLEKKPIPSLPWRTEVVFPDAKVAVDVRDCFWHGCIEHEDPERARNVRWQNKQGRNKERSLQLADDLAANGWKLIVAWNHDKSEDVVAAILDALRASGSQELGAQQRESGESIAA